MSATTTYYLTTRQCADYLGMSTDFVRGEIVDGRLACAHRLERPGGRTIYRPTIEEFRAYCQVNAKGVLALLPEQSVHNRCSR